MRKEIRFSKIGKTFFPRWKTGDKLKKNCITQGKLLCSYLLAHYFVFWYETLTWSPIAMCSHIRVLVDGFHSSKLSHLEVWWGMGGFLLCPCCKDVGEVVWYFVMPRIHFINLFCRESSWLDFMQNSIHWVFFLCQLDFDLFRDPMQNQGTTYFLKIRLIYVKKHMLAFCCYILLTWCNTVQYLVICRTST